MELKSVSVKPYTQKHWSEKEGLFKTEKKKKKILLSLQANKGQTI